MNLDLPAYDLVSVAFGAGGWLCAGALIGAFHFTTLRCNSLAFAGGGSILLAFGIQFARFLATGAMLFGIVRGFGAAPLLAASAGLLIARMALVRRGMQP